MEAGKRNFHDPNLEARVPDDENGYCLSLRDSIGGDVNWEAIHLSLCCGDRNFSVADRSLGGVLRVDDGAPCSSRGGGYP